MGRGIERRDIFIDDVDRDAFVERLAKIVERTGLEIHAWVLMPNHFHLLVRTAGARLERAMRSLLTGYALYFNRRHGRVGHLFQNRFKSIVCEQSRYFLELVRYIHLNPLRGGVVGSLEELETYPYSGHATLLGMRPRAWQTTALVHDELGGSLDRAVDAYRRFVAEGVSEGRRDDLVGGGLVRSAGGWTAVGELRRGREKFTRDERVLGSSGFVEQLLAEVGGPRSGGQVDLDQLVDVVCRSVGVDRSELRGRRRSRGASQARRGIAYLWLDRFGGSSRTLVELLGVSRVTVHRAAEEGRLSGLWDEVLRGLSETK